MIKPLSAKGKLVFAAVNAAGIAVYVAAMAMTVVSLPDGGARGFFFLAALAIAAGFLSVKIPGIHSILSLSDAFVALAVLFFGPAPAALIAGTEGFISTRRHSGRLLSALSSLSIMTVSVAAAGSVYLLTQRLLNAGDLGAPRLEQLFVPVMAMAAVNYLINSSLVATLTAVARRQPFWRTWRDNYTFTGVNFLAGSLAAALVYTLIDRVGASAVIAALPVVVVTYLTYRFYLGRLEDKNRFITHMNEVHLRMIEALAMAADARSQSSDGHLNRTQAYAVAFAELVNVDDDTREAIRAAALLHDVGKLAIPDYILNKPGQLTPAESSKVKTYPGIGADIVKNVDYPYPIVPLIRHHRENWDGSGYPDGLQGEDIPLGARMICLADSIDALLSARSYRPARAREEVVAIVREGAGSKFDPSLVQLFVDNQELFESIEKGIEVREFSGMKEIATIQTEHARTLYSGLEGVTPLQDISAVRTESMLLFDLARDLGASVGIKETLASVMGRLRTLVKFDTGVIYLYDPRAGLLFPAYVEGLNTSVILGRTLGRAEGITGWALNNGRTLTSSQPELDFFGSSLAVGEVYQSAVVVPLVSSGQSLGAITLYDRRRDPFTSETERLLEVIAPQAAAAIQGAQAYEASRATAMTDALTGLPNSRFLFQEIERELARAGRDEAEFGVAVLDLDHFKPINDTYGHHVGDEVLRALGKLLKTGLREMDIVCRWGGDEFVALLPNIDVANLEARLLELQEKIGSLEIGTSAGRAVKVGASVGWALYPADGTTYESLIRAADRRMYENKRARKAESGEEALTVS